MAQDLRNSVSIAGSYGDPASAISFSSNEVLVSIIEGLTVVKSADKTNWVDGPLTYTVVITNNSGSALTAGTLTDTIDTTLVDFNTTYGVMIGGTTYSEYTYSSGTLTITLPTIANGDSTTITFQVTRKS